MADSVVVIVDPFAGGGRGRSVWPAYEKALRRRFGAITVEMLGAPTGVSDLVVAAAGMGFGLLFVVGDTGSANEAVDALMNSGWPPDELPAFGLLPVGAGSDFSRALGISGTPEAIVAQAADGRNNLIDVVRVAFGDDDGLPRVRHMVNTAGLGLSARIAAKANVARLNRMFSSQTVFFLETLRALFTFRFPRVLVAVDGHEPIRTMAAEIVVANGRYYGGGMAIAPDAEVDDGAFDVVVIRAQSKIRLIDQINRIYHGGHRNAAFVDMIRGEKVRIAPAGPNEILGLVIDGIPVGRAPMQAEIVKSAVKVRSARLS